MKTKLLGMLTIRKCRLKNMVKMLRKEQRSIQEGFDSQQIRGRKNKQPVLKAEATDFITGITKTVYTQESFFVDDITTATSNNILTWMQSITDESRETLLPLLIPIFESQKSYVLRHLLLWKVLHSIIINAMMRNVFMY